MKIEAIDSATLASCIQSQQIKMDEFTRRKGELHNENFASIQQIKNLTNGAADVRKRKLSTPQNGGDDSLVAAAELNTDNTDNTDIEVKQIEDDNENKVYKWDIVWTNVILLGTLHVFALYGFYLRCLSVNLMSLPSTISKC